MKLIAAASGDDIDRATRGEVGARIKSRAANLKLLNTLIREIGGSGTYRFIGDINSVHLDAGCTTTASADRNPDKLILRRIEVAAIARLHARLLLCQVKKVSTVKWQLLNLLGRDHTIHCRARRIHDGLASG